jgi:putative oxidoreductase
MEVLTSKEKNSPHKLPIWLTFIRIALGMILFWKGILFIHDSSGLESMLQNSMHTVSSDREIKMLAYIIPYINLLGGLFIATGLFTRWASIIQIPILIGAVILLSTGKGIEVNNSESILSIIVLILLIVFAVKGSGFISADEFFHSYYKAGTENGNTENFFS